jgi:hypothetical protein
MARKKKKKKRDQSVIEARRPSSPDTRSAAVDRVVRSSVRVDRARGHLAEAVAAARGVGVTWPVIGQAVGLTGEGARARWGRG